MAPLNRPVPLFSATAWDALGRAAACAIAGALVGLPFGHPTGGLALGLALYGLSQIRQLLRFERWLRLRSVEPPPDTTGPWAEVIALATRLYRRKQFHKRRVVQLFREFRRMTASMPDGVVVLNGNDEIQWFNRQAATLLGLRRKVDFGYPIQNLVRQPAFVRFLEAARLAEAAAARRAVKDAAGDGMRSADAAGEEGEPTEAAVVIASPVATDRRLSFHLIAAYGMGQRLLLVRDVTREARLESMRKDFVANASHELRSPLTVISGYLDTLAEEGALDAAWQGPVAEMRRQTLRMTEIVDSLLELSRLEASGREAPLERIDLAGLVAQLRRDLMAGLVRPGVFEVDVPTPAILLGAPAEVHSIVSNLLTNAVKYTPEGGRIAVRWSVDANGGHLAVTDSGIGIAREHLPRLTERFYRVDPGRSRKEGGTGLGLAIVKHAVQRHGGSLEIASVEGRCSTFTCHFPLRRVVLAAP
ncbi:MAG: Phosphate regulon sensor protein PhoR [Pseudomonadota bacterium]|jgi:two-component system phosphate regulon sensor histidine kinase PhoR